MSDHILSNDTVQLTPRTDFHGPALSFDFPSIKIGIAEYEEGPTGCTVFYFPDGAQAAIDLRGNVPATISTDNHHLLSGDRVLHAVCFAGGSIYGLEAITGVSAELLKMGGYSVNWWEMPKVSGAVMYDFLPRKNIIYPDKALGRAALRTAQSGIFPLGAQGAGRSATVGKGQKFDQWEHSGQGGAFRQIGPTKIAVFTVVNAIGAILNRNGEIVRGYKDRTSSKWDDVLLKIDPTFVRSDEDRSVNTTLTLVVTNQKLSARSLRQLARQVHTSMARAIYPFHTIDDGDVLFMLTTNEIENPQIDTSMMGVLASEIAWDAVLNSWVKNLCP